MDREELVRGDSRRTGDSGHSGNPSTCSSIWDGHTLSGGQLSLVLTQAAEEVLNPSLLSGGHMGSLLMLSWETATPEGQQWVLRGGQL